MKSIKLYSVHIHTIKQDAAAVIYSEQNLTKIFVQSGTFIKRNFTNILTLLRQMKNNRLAHSIMP